MRLFPILKSNVFRAIPWSMLEPHEGQAEKNHYQSLKRLAERGGLSPCEAVAVLEDRKYHRMSDDEAEMALIRLLASQ